MTNAFNLLDNMDGLCAGIALIVGAALLIDLLPGSSGTAFCRRPVPRAAARRHRRLPRLQHQPCVDLHGRQRFAAARLQLRGGDAELRARKARAVPTSLSIVAAPLLVLDDSDLRHDAGDRVAAPLRSIGRARRARSLVAPAGGDRTVRAPGGGRAVAVCGDRRRDRRRGRLPEPQLGVARRA